MHSLHSCWCEHQHLNTIILVYVNVNVTGWDRKTMEFLLISFTVTQLTVHHINCKLLCYIHSHLISSAPFGIKNTRVLLETNITVSYYNLIKYWYRVGRVCVQFELLALKGNKKYWTICSTIQLNLFSFHVKNVSIVTLCHVWFMGINIFRISIYYLQNLKEKSSTWCLFVCAWTSVKIQIFFSNISITYREEISA